MSTETLTEEIIDLDGPERIRQNMPESCQGCSFAEVQIEQLGWTVALGRLTAERAVKLVLERTRCSAVS